ncbi:hypothetical protein EON76_00235 [bacterium]|nr:MAG: hypothetical protein EON76_00235 [bacterium]
MKPRHAYKYKVFLDSNAMRDIDWLKDNFFERLDALKKEELAEVEFILPEIIKQEWINHYLTVAISQQSKLVVSARNLNAMGLEAASHSVISREKIIEKAESILTDNSLAVVETPYTSIDWSDLMRRAVEHVPPFDIKYDRGIKDGVFAQTILHYFRRNRSKKNMQFAIITNDGRLKEYLSDICKSQRITVHNTIEDFKSRLKLSIEQQSTDLLSIASAMFYTSGDDQSLYWTAHIAAEMSKQYKEIIGDSVGALVSTYTADQIISDDTIPNADNWTPIDRKLTVKSTSFSKREGSFFYWLTPIVYKQAYALTSQNDPEHSSDLSPSVVHTVVFIAQWSFKVGNKGQVSRPKLLSLTHGDGFASVDMHPNIDWQNGTTNLTRPTFAAANSGLASLQETMARLSGATSAPFDKITNALSFPAVTPFDTSARWSQPTGALQRLLGRNTDKTDNQ